MERFPQPKLTTTGDVTLQRIVAYLVDSILIAVVGIPFALVASVLGNTAGILLTLAGLAVILVYVFLLEGLIGYTPGKYLLGLVVVKSDGSRCTIGAALIRNLAWVIQRQGEYTRLTVRNECYDRDGRNRATNRRVMKPT